MNAVRCLRAVQLPVGKNCPACGAMPRAGVVRQTPRQGHRGLADPRAWRIDLRSRSLFGLFDWGKNRARMVELTARFGQQGRA